MDSNQSAISWSAIAAGATAAAALTLILVSLGTAFGFSSISPWPHEGISATTFKISTGLYLVFTAMVASTVGGYISGCLRTKWTGLQNYEIQFRDTAHGFLAWAFATIVGVAFLGTAATVLVGATAGAGSGNPSSSPADYYVAALMQPNAAGSATSPPSGNSAGESATRNQYARSVFSHVLAAGGDFSDADRAILIRLTATQTGLNQADAEKRVSDVTTKTKADADRARQVAASISIWLTIAMFVGAFSASLAAIEGGQLRDRRWRGIVGARAYNEARIEP